MDRLVGEPECVFQTTEQKRDDERDWGCRGSGLGCMTKDTTLAPTSRGGSDIA